MKKNIIIYPGSDHVFQTLLYDARGLDSVSIYDNLFKSAEIEGKLSRFKRKHKLLWKFFGQYVINRQVDQLNGISKMSTDTIFVFSNISVRYISQKLLRQIRNRNCNIVLYFIDSISNPNSKEAYQYTKLGLFDIIYSFDKRDAEKYGFNHFYTMYSRKFVIPIFSEKRYDAVYIGSNKGRYQLLLNLKERLKKSKLYVNMLNITKEQLVESGFQDSRSIQYIESLGIVKSANCIIDLVLDPDQSGLSLRAYEAIAFNKKLITNNKSIKDFPFYNPKYMLYFDNVDDIDESFIKQSCDVDYEYNDEYSPINFLDNINIKLGNG